MLSPKKTGQICASLALLMPVALFFHLKSTVLPILHPFSFPLRCELPPFHIFLLLSIILSILLVNAGLFKNDVADAIVTNQSAGEFRVVALQPNSDGWTEQEDDLHGVDLTMIDSVCSKTESCTAMKEPSLSALMENGEDEDIHQFHKRVEAFILKVQAGFFIEQKSFSLL